MADIIKLTVAVLINLLVSVYAAETDEVGWAVLFFGLFIIGVALMIVKLLIKDE